MQGLIEIPILLALMFSAPILQIKFASMRLRGLIKIPLWAVNFSAMILGFIFPVLGMFVFLYNLPPGIKCASGAPAIPLLGIFFTLIAVPLISLINFLKYREKVKGNTSLDDTNTL